MMPSFNDRLKKELNSKHRGKRRKDLDVGKTLPKAKGLVSDQFACNAQVDLRRYFL